LPRWRFLRRLKRWTHGRADFMASRATSPPWVSIRFSTLTTGIRNTAIGDHALYRTPRAEKHGHRWEALITNQTGSNNTATVRGSHLEHGSNNTASGAQALFQNTTGANNTAAGFSGALSEHRRRQQYGHRLSGAQ